MIESKVIGYIAYIDKEYPICSGDACLISGSESEVLSKVMNINPENRDSYRTRKARFGDIVNGMQHGGAYAFDKESYSRFFPLAKQVGLNVSEANFEEMEKQGDEFFTVRLDI